ncbi:YraN family protein [Williamsia sp. CHRR-6]|uniref:YraN family protein n=1 Tax=Williamsia sp. CHRR-6 TaxID=2835871 RepID=UPI001BDADB58|nr:YraN family protein [Williamsia sp. CHRR-6]MBT0568370.1 YraN family protein [Williamsia sp. CHRR-6]
MATSRREPDRRRQIIGRRGEDAAADHLEKSGWQVLERNWRCRYGELDLIALDGDVLVAVEVKTRTGTTFGDPAAAVTADKYRRLRRLIQLWLAQQQRRWPAVRFDVIAVSIDSTGRAHLRHLRGVF